MKKVYILMILLGIGYFSNAQVGKDSAGLAIKDSASDDEDKIFTKVENEAYFPGGDKGWRGYLVANLNASTPIENGAGNGTYTIIIRFIVGKDGTVEDVVAETKYGYGMEAECIRILKNGPKWIPGKQNGRIVRSYRRQPITFVVSPQ